MAKTRSIAVPSRGNGYESVTVRPIDNGFLICRHTGNGYSEVYSATKPKIEVPGAPSAKRPSKPSAPSGASALRMAAAGGSKKR